MSPAASSAPGGPGVTAARGFLAAGIHCGVKRQRRDLGLLWSEAPANAAAMFTTNQVQAAPVRYCRRVLGEGPVRAIVVNSGNANACTGTAGDAAAEGMALAAAAALGLPSDQVLVASTGVIGIPLPIEPIEAGLPRAAGVLSSDGGAFARAILTTDAGPKTAATTLELGGTTLRIGGTAKGAGMIHPNMATMLAFLCTDARVPVPALRQALREAVAASFNRISVDGDTSTNDSVFLLANGCAGGAPITGGAELARFTAALSELCQDLALQIVRDGEGATRLVEIRVGGAASDEDARLAAHSVGTSLLVKTMLWGGEPNWGRVLAALGRAGIALDPDRIALDFGPVPAVRGGLGVPGSGEAAARALRAAEVAIHIDLGLGAGAAGLWTCDLNPEYVRINGSYLS